MPTVAVAYSGGRDSTALLHATLQCAQALGVRVAALHVHHGLSAHADAWLAHCEALCGEWSAAGDAPLRFVATRLTQRPAAGESIEAWARRQRYRALRAMALAEGASLVLLAHHRRDQAETFLLQALRSAGVRGQSAMPRTAERAGLTWARPWLDQPREAIDAYVARHRLPYVDDDSNASPRHARNRLRAQVWPALEGAFPAAERTLAAAAAWAQQARQAMDELASIDLAAVCSDRGLRLAAWRVLSPARRSHVLRAWIALQTGRPPAATLVERLLREADRPGVASWPLQPADARVLRRYRGWLAVAPASAPTARAAPPGEQPLCIRDAGLHPIDGWSGRLSVEHTVSEGVALSRLLHLAARPRKGAEQFQLAPGRPPRSLKKQYQSLGIDAPAREGPLLFLEGQLLFAPGLGIDARAWAPPGVPQVRLAWYPDSRSAQS